METFIVGTKEPMIIPFRDRMNGIDTLDGSNLQYRITKKDDGTEVLPWTAGDNFGMNAYCMVDLTAGTWELTHYAMYVKFEALADETPVKGPFEFRVDE